MDFILKNVIDGINKDGHEGLQIIIFNVSMVMNGLEGCYGEEVEHGLRYHL
jgi:hypothetical protein